MFLSKIHLDLRCKEVRRDVADPYEMHSTLCRAFSSTEQKCLPGTFLWRLEPETSTLGMPIVIVQSKTIPDWSKIPFTAWFHERPFAPLDINEKLQLDPDKVVAGIHFRFRLRANPSVCRNRKRFGLYKPEEQDEWLVRQGNSNGFIPIVSNRSKEIMLMGNKRSGAIIRTFSVLYDGVLKVNDSSKFIKAVLNGIGHGKSMGLGLFSVIPSR